METNSIKVFIYSLSGGVLFSGNDTAVFVPAHDGCFELRSKHIPVCAVLSDGFVTMKNSPQKIAITNGSICMFFQDSLSIFVS